LRKLRSQNSYSTLQKQLESIRNDVEDSKRRKKGLWALFKSHGPLRGLIINFGIMFFKQLSGISVILGFMQTIFDATGSTIPADISSIIIGSLQVIICFAASQLVDRLGRRILLLISMVGITISLGVLGTYFHLKNNGINVDSLFWVPVACLILYMLFYNFGIGPLSWVIMGEMFAPDVKAMATTLTTFFCLIVGFVTTVFFPNFLIMFGIAASFWIFAVISAVGVIFVALMVPETKGKTLLEIQTCLNRENK